MRLRKWNGVQNQELFADIIYPKDADEGTVRLVLRASSGRVKESILDFNLNTGITLFPISPVLAEQIDKNVIEDSTFAIQLRDLVPPDTLTEKTAKSHVEKQSKKAPDATEVKK